MIQVTGKGKHVQINPFEPTDRKSLNETMAGLIRA
jgi:hypothetical protein